MKKNSHRFLTSSPASETLDGDEFDESDIWGFGLEDRRNPIPVSRPSRKKPEMPDRPTTASAAASLPMNIPDWSKILKEEKRGVVALRGNRMFECGEDDDDEAMVSGSVIPPHEMLWRRREASFSVQEGIGRTLKGRDLSRVRDGIWLRMGFVD